MHEYSSLGQSGGIIKIALVGCGRISGKHFESIAHFEERLKLVDVCDDDDYALNKACEKTGAKGHHDLASMLTSTEAELVVLTTPSGFHANQAVTVAESGRHVLTEKPMATTLNDGKLMIEACEKAGVRLFVVKQNRRNSTLQRLKQAIDDGRFGKIYLVNINVFWNRPQSYYDSADWRGTWEFDGGALMNQASHYIDLIDWLIGPLDSLHAYSSTLARDIEVEDTSVLNLKWKCGALGSMNVTMLTYPNNFEGSITIIGELGTARVGGVAVNKIEHWQFHDSKAGDLDVLNSNYDTPSVYGFGHTAIYKNIIDVFDGVSEPFTDGEDGLKSIEILAGAYLSAKTEKTIRFPLPKL